MVGAIMAAVAGAAMSLQGVFNARLSEKAGLMVSGAFVQVVAAVLAVAAALAARDGNLQKLGQTNRVYWLGGVLGLVITLTVMVATRRVGARHGRVGHFGFAAVDSCCVRRVWLVRHGENRVYLAAVGGACSHDQRRVAISKARLSTAPLRHEGGKRF